MERGTAGVDGGWWRGTRMARLVEQAMFVEVAAEQAQIAGQEDHVGHGELELELEIGVGEQTTGDADAGIHLFDHFAKRGGNILKIGDGAADANAVGEDRLIEVEGDPIEAFGKGDEITHAEGEGQGIRVDEAIQAFDKGGGAFAGLPGAVDGGREIRERIVIEHLRRQAPDRSRSTSARKAAATAA